VDSVVFFVAVYCPLHGVDVELLEVLDGLPFMVGAGYGEAALDEFF